MLAVVEEANRTHYFLIYLMKLNLMTSFSATKIKFIFCYIRKPNVEGCNAWVCEVFSHSQTPATDDMDPSVLYLSN